MKDQIFDVESTIIEDSSRELTFWEKFKENQIIRKTLILIGFAIIWEVCARLINNPMMLPTFVDTANALWASLFDKTPSNNLLNFVGATIFTLFGGFLIGTILAIVCTVIAVNTKIGEDILMTLSSIAAPLPAVALSPLFFLILGINISAVLATAAVATFFPVALTMLMGFKTSSQTVLNVGKNIGLSGLAYTVKIRIPDTLPAILTGLRNGFSNGFRALVAVEMVLGSAVSIFGFNEGGIGAYLMASKNQLMTDQVYGGIIVTMIIGLLFEAIFAYIEKKTVKKYGMMSN